MIARCALPRNGAEGMFRTDFKSQRRVISAIATLTGRSYRVFFKGEDSSLLTTLTEDDPNVLSLSIR